MARIKKKQTSFFPFKYLKLPSNWAEYNSERAAASRQDGSLVFVGVPTIS